MYGIHQLLYLAEGRIEHQKLKRVVWVFGVQLDFSFRIQSGPPYVGNYVVHVLPRQMRPF